MPPKSRIPPPTPRTLRSRSAAIPTPAPAPSTTAAPRPAAKAATSSHPFSSSKVKVAAAPKTVAPSATTPRAPSRTRNQNVGPAPPASRIKKPSGAAPSASLEPKPFPLPTAEGGSAAQQGGLPLAAATPDEPARTVDGPPFTIVVSGREAKRLGDGLKGVFELAPRTADEYTFTSTLLQACAVALGGKLPYCTLCGKSWTMLLSNRCGHAIDCDYLRSLVLVEDAVDGAAEPAIVDEQSEAKAGAPLVNSSSPLLHPSTPAGAPSAQEKLAKSAVKPQDDVQAQRRGRTPPLVWSEARLCVPAISINDSSMGLQGMLRGGGGDMKGLLDESAPALTIESSSLYPSHPLPPKSPVSASIMSSPRELPVRSSTSPPVLAPPSSRMDGGLVPNDAHYKTADSLVTPPPESSIGLASLLEKAQLGNDGFLADESEVQGVGGAMSEFYAQELDSNRPRLASTHGASASPKKRARTQGSLTVPNVAPKEDSSIGLQGILRGGGGDMKGLLDESAPALTIESSSLYPSHPLPPKSPVSASIMSSPRKLPVRSSTSPAVLAAPSSRMDESSIGLASLLEKAQLGNDGFLADESEVQAVGGDALCSSTLCSSTIFTDLAPFRPATEGRSRSVSPRKRCRGA